MTTKAIGIKQFRQNMTSLWKEANNKQVKYIIMYHSKPILEVRPLDTDELVLENFMEGLNEARKEASKGKLTPQEVVFKNLDLI